MNLHNITIVLKQPRYPENIGATARTICNMGIAQLVVIDPRNCDLTKVLKMATHVAFDVVENMEIFPDIKEALAPYQYVVGATARLGRQRQAVHSPSGLAEKLVPISHNNRIAILFGPEDRGLSNTDIRFCHTLVNIPTAQFSSLNLAQAVMVICYELFLANQTEKSEHTPRLASHHELEGMYDQLKDVLVRVGYINAENPDYWMGKLRHFFNRIQLKAREVNIIRGICRQVDWYGRKRYDDGLKTTTHGTTPESKRPKSE
jgi:tRNA/rRNA methyltransferase